MIPFESVNIVQEAYKSGQYTIATYANQLTGYFLTSLNDPNFGQNPQDHLWSRIGGLYTLFDYNRINQTYPNGGFNGTILEDLVASFGSTGVYAFQLNRSTYRSDIDGVSIGIKLPLNSAYTGITSGLSSTVVYSAYIYNPNSRQLPDGQLCGGCEADIIKSEIAEAWTNNINFGYAKINGTNPDPTNTVYPYYYDSGWVFLFTDDVYFTFTGSTGSSISWSTGFGEDNPYSRFNKRLAVPTLNEGFGYHDRAVGGFDLKSGTFYIWGPLAQAIDTTAFSGSFTTGATPGTSGTTIVQGVDYDYETYANATLILKPGQLTSTGNPSFVDANGNCDLVASGICVKDIDGNTVAISVPDTAITIDPNQFFTTNIKLSISGDITKNPNGIIVPLV